jgi:membrane-associated phospholipid phosphatase
MQTVGLSWQHSVEAAAVLAAVGIALRNHERGPVRSAAAFLRETAVIGVLYAVWQLAGSLSVMRTDDAYARARWIIRFEGDIGLPFEGSVQHLILDHRLLVQGANLYYAAMHMTTMLGFLIWLFVRHREHYRPVRQVMAWSTLACLVIQLLPVAPPRLLPGVVDTGTMLNQSVYNSRYLAFDQFAAMPSVHVLWALILGWYVWKISPSRWRWLAPAHAALMVFVVVLTGNHWWLDGIVAAVILMATAFAAGRIRRLRTSGSDELDRVGDGVENPAGSVGVALDIGAGR